MTNRCQNCGATAPPNTPACPYCRATTEYGSQLRNASVATETYKQQAQAQLEVHHDWQKQKQRREAFERAATYSLITSLVGLVTCFLPIAPIIAVVLAIKAMRLASQHGFTRPTRAVFGMILGIAGFALGVAGIGWFFADMARQDEALEELRAKVRKGAARKKLDKKTACRLAKIDIIESPDYGIYDQDGADCRGRLKREGDQAVLPGVRISSVPAKTVVACLQRNDGRWVIHSLRDDENCWAAPPASASASTAASASASTAASASARRAP